MGALKQAGQPISKWETLAWRVEALRSGKPYAEIAERRSLVYRVEQLFLLHRATQHPLLHLAADPASAARPGEAEPVLLEIQQFAREYLTTGYESHVEAFPVGEAEVWIAPGRYAFLAGVIRGHAPDDLRTAFQEAVARLHAQYGLELERFDGDVTAFASATPLVAGLLRSESKSPAHHPVVHLPRLHLPRFQVPQLQLPKRKLLPVAGAVVALVAIAFGALALRSERRWQAFVARLKSEPGILVAVAEKQWFAPSRIAGLRDPRAADPAAVAREVGVNPERIQFEWKEYSAGEIAAVPRAVSPRIGASGTPGAVRQRSGIAAPQSRHALEEFEARFPLPPNVKANVANQTLVLAGSAPYEWIDSVREGATKIPGITAINGDDLVVEFDPELVLQRFREQFGMPETVQAALRSGRLLLTGEAPHEWLDRVRRGAMKLPGIHVVDDRRVVDMDQRAFHEAKAALEQAAVLFVLNRDSIPSDATPVLVRVAEEGRRCLGAAANLGINVTLELRGYGDAVATEAENAKLSQRRAEAVRAAMARNGIEPAKLSSLGLGTPPRPEAGEKTGAGKFDRRVFFRVVIQP